MLSKNGKESTVPTSFLKRKSTEDLSLKRMLPLLKDITLMPAKPTKKESINSPFSLKKNSSPNSWPPCTDSELKSQLITLTLLTVILIGPPKTEPSLPLKTKELVDLAGLSVPLELLNHGLELKETKWAFLNNNLLIAQDLMETMDVKEDGPQLPSSTFKPTELPQPMIIPMLLKIKLARWPEDLSKLEDKKPTLNAQDWLMVFQQAQFQLLLMPLTGAHITVVSSALVEPESTMQFSLSELLLMEPGKSRTLGDLHGENLDSSD